MLNIGAPDGHIEDISGGNELDHRPGSLDWQPA